LIPERGVSYYGVAYPDRAASDYAEMVDHGCNAVLLAVSEFDWWFWRKNVVRLIDAAKDHGLTTYVDLWGWGKTLAGEPPSLFLMRSLDGRQRAASGKTYHATCLNYAPFREHLRSSVTEIITETSVDGLFWDEPHYANWHDPDWACTCPICGALYRELHGEDMPRELTPEVIEFREDKAVGFLRELSEHVKETDPKVDVTCCLLPTKSPLIGITDWRGWQPSPSWTPWPRTPTTSTQTWTGSGGYSSSGRPAPTAWTWPRSMVRGASSGSWRSGSPLAGRASSQRPPT
jgi:hypothetical protein